MRKIRLIIIKGMAGMALVCMMACGQRDAAQPLELLARQVEDSLRVFNIPFVREAVAQGMRAASDSDAYYNFLMYASILHYYSAQPDSMMACVDRTLGYLRRHLRNRSRSRLLVKCLQTRGAYYAAYRYDLDSLVYYNRLACMEAERGVDVEDIVLSYNNLADAYRQQGKLDASAEAYRRAIFIADSVCMPRENYVPLYEGIATTYTALHAFGESKEWWEKSKGLWDCMMTREKFNYLNNRGTDYYYQEDYAGCKRLLLQLDAFLAGHPDMLWERQFCRVNLTDVFLKEGNAAGADSLLRETCAFFASLGDEVTLSYIRTQQMEQAFLGGNTGQVRRLLQENPLPQEARPDVRLQRLGFLYRFYSGQEEWKQAYDARVACEALADSLRDERVRMKTADMQLRYERDTTVLSQQVRINRQQMKLMRVYAVLLAALALLFLLAFLVYYWRKKVRAKEERMLRRIVDLRMESIRNRITPHFIYNALNHELLLKQQGKESQLGDLVQLLRRQQTLASTFCTSLKEELGFVRLYVAAETERLDVKPAFSIHIADGIDPEHMQLPSMMVQIFVENAIKHGLKGTVPADGKPLFLRIDVYASGGCRCIDVYNNGNSLQESAATGQGTGLKIVSQTIQLLNEANRHPMSYSVGWHWAPGGEKVWLARLVIPEGYEFDNRFANT